MVILIIKISVYLVEFFYLANGRIFGKVGALRLQKLEIVRHQVVTVRLSRAWI